MKTKLPKLLKDGSEQVDTTPVVMPVSRFQSTNDMDIKLKAMVARALADREPISEDEILGDEIDWDLPDDKPQNRFIDNIPSRKELKNAFKKFAKKKQAASSDDDDGEPTRPLAGKSGKASVRPTTKKMETRSSQQSEADASDE